MKRWKVLGVLAGILIASLTVVSSLSNRVWKIPTSVAQKGEFIIGITEVGALAAEKSTTISSSIPGQSKIIKLAPEGSEVKEQEPVVWLDTSELEKQIKEARTNLKTAESNLEKTKENIKLARFQNEMNVKSAKAQVELTRIELENTRSNLEKTKRLFEAELVSAKAVEEEELHLLRAQLSAQNAEISLKRAEEAQKSGEVTLECDLANSQTQAEESKRKLEQLEQQLDKAIVKSPNTGILIYSKTWRGAGPGKMQEGDQIYQGQSIMEIPDLSKMINTVFIDEVDISTVKEGQEVRIIVDALPDLDLKGKVSKIAALAIDKGSRNAPWWLSQQGSGAKAFEVTVAVDGSDERLRPGMTTKSSIEVEHLKDAVWVPLESIFDFKGKKVVYVLASLNTHRKEIVTGKDDGVRAVVEKGLNGGENVCLRDPTRKLKPVKSKSKSTGSSSPLPAP
jgi:HlyD family secretion protein